MEGRGKKILFGCLGGCGALVVVFVGSCVGFTMWLNAPGEVLEPEVLLTPDTTGYVEWILRLEDPGTKEFTEALLRSFDDLAARSNSPLPDGFEAFLNARQAKEARKDMERLFPVVVAWTARPGGGPDEDAHLFSVSARGIGHQMILFDWFLGFLLGRVEGDVETVRHRGEKIFRLKKTGGVEPAVFVRDGIVFVGTDVDAVRETLDRLEDPALEPGAGLDLEVLYDALPADRALRGALTNRRGEVRRILDHLGLPTGQAPEAAWDDLTGLTVAADFRDEDVFAGTLELHGPDAEWAATHAEPLGTALVALFDRWEVEVETDIASLGRRIRVDFRAPDLLGRLGRLDRTVRLD